MKLNLILIFVVLILAGCKKDETQNLSARQEDKLLGSWVGNGTHYAGSKIPGTTVFTFNNDYTFVALDKAKGMPTITERGEWLVNGDTLKLKFKKEKKRRIDELAYEERNGGPLDIIKPVPDDSSGIVTWNYKITGNKLQLGSINASYTNMGEFTREN